MPKGKDRRSRISQGYLPHLEAIAAIYVAEQGVAAAAARRVRAELGLRSFREDRFPCWAGKPEWQAAIEAAEEARQLANRTQSSVRGKRFLEWVRDTLQGLRDRYDKLDADENDDVRAKLEARILRLADAARAEERHLEAQKQAEAKRDMKRYASALVAALNEVGLPDEARIRLAEIARDPSKLLLEDR